MQCKSVTFSAWFEALPARFRLNHILEERRGQGRGERGREKRRGEGGRGGKERGGRGREGKGREGGKGGGEREGEGISDDVLVIFICLNHTLFLSPKKAAMLMFMNTLVGVRQRV